MLPSSWDTVGSHWGCLRVIGCSICPVISIHYLFASSPIVICIFLLQFLFLLDCKTSSYALLYGKCWNSDNLEEKKLNVSTTRDSTYYRRNASTKVVPSSILLVQAQAEISLLRLLLPPYPHRSQYSWGTCPTPSTRVPTIPATDDYSGGAGEWIGEHLISTKAGASSTRNKFHW